MFICLFFRNHFDLIFQTSTNAQPPQPPTNTTATPTRLASTLLEALLANARPVSLEMVSLLLLMALLDVTVSDGFTTNIIVYFNRIYVKLTNF